MPMKIGEDKFYTLDEIAKASGITLDSLRRFANTGRLKAKKVGGKYWVQEADYKALFSAESKQRAGKVKQAKPKRKA